VIPGRRQLRRFSTAKQLEVNGKFRKAVTLIVRDGHPVPAGRELAPAAELDALARAELETAVNAKKHRSRVYESLRNLNEVIGTQYGDRVLYELIQNAHDAHDPGEQGRISIRLVVNSATEGCLFIANCGTGFGIDDVEAIRNLAISAKEIGEGIGNKGLGFRSIEALTDDVRIYSQEKAQQSERFDGYCFRFASTAEIEAQLHSDGVETGIAKEVARTLPRFLILRPLYEQSDQVTAFARSGYATVIVAPLRSSEAVDLATEQVHALADSEAPLLLFLDRIGEIRIEVQAPNQMPFLRLLHRRQTSIREIPRLPGCGMCEVDLGEEGRYLVVRRELDKTRVLESVQRSIPKAPQLKRWLNWKGQPIVSIAVGLFSGGVI
jgi:anti-sigma regulatory factor (Ser/Thr protein kinase)